jgi:hypothetical protein
VPCLVASGVRNGIDRVTGRKQDLRMPTTMLRPLSKAPIYYVARQTGRLRPRPLNLTFSVTYPLQREVQDVQRVEEARR